MVLCKQRGSESEGSGRDPCELGSGGSVALSGSRVDAELIDNVADAERL